MDLKHRKIVGILIILVFISGEFTPFLSGFYSVVSADVQPPRSSRNLKELVDDLMSATPLEDRFDLDGDGLFDIVEVVIGTDYNNTDSDFDLLSDYQEVHMDSDPLDPDSNSDGLPDYNEVNNVTSLDLDGDNVTNIWDLDNDGDGLNDEVDLSPFSKSGTYDSFHFDLELNGKPTYIVLQFKPGNPENLKLYHQIWDWPSDSDGLMKDLDGSEEDLKVVPQLNVTVNYLPSQEDVSNYGILVTDTGMNVPVYPVWENDDIVAFTAQIFYNTTVPLSLSMDAELIWRGIGYNDEAAKALLAGNGLYASISTSGSVIAAGSEVTNLETFLWMEMGEDKVALKQHNGPYISVSESGSLVLGGYEPGENEIFQIIDMGNETIALKASNGLYVSATADGSLIANSSSAGSMETFTPFDWGFLGEWKILVTYEDEFSLTGFTVSESYGSDLGLFYSDQEENTLQANIVLGYEFLRNASNQLKDMPSILSGYNAIVSSVINSYANKDEALVHMSNVLLPEALDSLPPDQILPVTLCMSEKTVIVEMSQLSPDYLMGDTYNVNMIGEPHINTRTLKTNYYNTSSYESLGLPEVMHHIDDWEMSDEARFSASSLMLMWNTGEQTVASMGSYEVSSLVPEEFIAAPIAFEAMLLLARGGLGLKAYRSLKYLRSMGMNSASIAKMLKTSKTSGFVLWAKMCTKLNKAKEGFAGIKGLKTLKKAMKGIEVLGVMIDVGLSIFAGVMLAEQIGGHLGTSLGASYGIVAASYAIMYTAVLFAVGQIPFVGWAFTLAVVLADIFGGFSDKLMGWLMNIFGPSDLAVVEGFLEEIWIPSITITDKDGNGLDVGDRVSINVRTKSKVNVTSGRETGWAQYSWYRPYISIAAPPGSYSNTSYSGIPPISEMVIESGSNWKTEEYNTSAWIEPGIGMPNFPVNVKLNIDYRLWNVWEHFVFYVFYWEWCRHEDKQEGESSSHFTTLYYDVLPGTIDDFWGWRGVKPLDSDGDGLKDSKENSSSPWRYDSDGDGLNDKFEVSIGTTATSIDTDRDGLNDRFEILYDTNATDRDTDGDGLQDYVEIAGWLIEFTYHDVVITSRVTSDPRVKDTDGDGVDDLMEYWSNLNPRSGDTDGDGVQDVSNPVIPGTYVEFVQRLNIEPDHVDDALEIIDIACDDEGKLYALMYEGKTYPNVRHYNVSVFDTNMNLESSWVYLLDETGVYPYAEFRNTNFNSHIIIDGDKIHITHAYRRVPEIWHATRSNIKSFYLNGTEIEGYWATREDIEGPFRLGLTVDSSGNTYVSRSWNWGHWGDGSWGIWSYIDVYSPNKTHVDSIGEYMDPDNPTLDKFAYITDVAYNPVTDLLYIADNGYTMDGAWSAPNEKVRDDRIAIFETDGTYITSWVGYNNDTLNIGFDWILSLDIDEGGFVYVLDSRNHRVHKFDPNGIPILSFGGQGVNDGLFELSPMQLCVNDELVYVLEPPYSEAYREYHIHQFNLTYEEPSEIQDPVPDRDGDGLNNTDEEAGWEVTFTNATGIYTLNVTSDPMLPDTDFDGLTDLQEFNAKTNPRHTDTDNDGVPDLEEYEWHNSPSMNPKHWDTDGEGLEDATELVYGSDPTLQDTDGDGLTDLEEFLLNSKPNDTDTDDDGLSDYYERYVSNSSLISPDSDGDFLFDGSEDEWGTDPWNGDSDNDTLADGHEVLFGTDPMNWDTDGDNLTDGYELDLWLDPLNNDTDGDGLLDSTELTQGTNPFIGDTDFDGIPDDEDTDSNRTILTSLVLAYDSCNASVEFAEALQGFANVTVVSKEELLSSYKNASRIVLVGRPEGDGAVGKLVRDLLLDSGEVLTDMLESDYNRFALRHGLWNNTQTIVLLSEPHPMDHLRILEMLMEKTVTIYPDTVFVDYDNSLAVRYPSGGSLNHSDISYNFFTVDEIDTVKETDARIYGILEDASSLSLEITRYNASTTPHSLTNQTGLANYQLALGRYLDIKAGDDLLHNSSVLLESAWIQIFYKDSELDISGNGYIGDPEDIDESSLTLYIYEEISSDWSQVTENLDGVLDTGVNTTDIQIYGEQYSGYVWAALSHFSLYGLGGMTFNKPPDTSEAYPSIPVLWPPNHKMTNITILGVKDPDGDPVTIRIDSITSDEPTITNEKRDPHAPDAYGLGTSIASLRAERNGGGNGRVYVVNFTASDGRGGVATGTVAVYVPHNVNKICIDDGQIYNATELNFLYKDKKKDPSPVIDSNSDPIHDEEETHSDQVKGQKPKKNNNKEKADKTSVNNSNKDDDLKVKSDKKTYKKMVQVIEEKPKKPEKEKEKPEKREESEKKEKEDKELKKEK